MAETPIPLPPWTPRPRPPSFPFFAKFMQPQSKPLQMPRPPFAPPRSTGAECDALVLSAQTNKEDRDSSESLTLEHVCEVS